MFGYLDACGDVERCNSGRTGRCVVDSYTVGEILAEYRVRWRGDVIHLKACGDGSAKRM